MTNELTQSELILSDPRPLDQNPAAVYIASLPAETGRRTQAQALKTIAGIIGADLDTLNWAALRYQHTAAIRARLAEVYAPATANKMLSALRQALKQSWLLGQMTVEDYRRAAELKPVTGETIPAGRDLSQGEILALMTACMEDKTPAGTRDAAIIGMMYAAGLRRHEVVKIDVSDFDPDTGALIVHGKRNKDRTAYITNGALDALRDWLEARGSQPGALFVAINKGGKITGGRMTPQAVYNLLQKRATAAGVKEFSPHDIRRTFAGDLLDKGADIATVAKLGGWANVQTAARYDRRGERAKQQAASLLHVPYKRRGG